MNLSKIFIERPIMTVLVMFFLILMGALGYYRLPISDMPDIDFPTITVKVSYPGTSPDKMSNIVAAPLEKQFMQIPGITSVTSQNTLGATTLVLNFELDRDIDLAAMDVQQAITRAETFLPPDLPSPPTYQKVNPSDTPVIYMAMMSDVIDLGELYKYAFTLVSQRLSTIEGVAQILVYGSPYATRVDIDPYLVSTMGLSWDVLSQKVIASTPNLPVGQLDGQEHSWIISSEANLQNGDEFSPVIVRWEDGAPVRLKDIGKPIDSLDNTRIGVKYYSKDLEKGVPAIVLAILKRPGANTVKLSRLIHEELPNLLKQIPQSIDFRIVYDKAETIKSSIEEVELTLLVAFILVTAIIFFYLGSLTDTIIPAVAMPMSIIMTCWFMDLFGFTIDNLSLLGFILATGFIVDDAIVVLENIVHLMEKGSSRWKAALEGSRLIGFTIVSMTLSLIAVFIPLIYMSGIIGKLFLEFSIVMITVILCSGFISLTLTPMLCSRFLSIEKGFTKKLSDTLNEKFNKLYENSLRKVIRYKKTILVIGILNVFFSLVLAKHLPTDFLPDDDIGLIQGFTLAAEGTSPEKMSQLQDEIATRIYEDPNIESVISAFGYPQTNQGVLYMRLTPLKDRTVPNALAHFHQKLSRTAGVNTFLKNVPLINLNIGTMSRGQYQYVLQGWNRDDVFASTSRLYEKLLKLPELQGLNYDMQTNSPQLNLHIFREQAASFGVTAEEIQKTLLLAYSGNRVALISTPYDQYNVIVGTPKDEQSRVEDLKSLWVKSQNNSELVPLSAVADWDLGVGPSQVNHYNQFPAVTFAYNLSEGVALSDALQKVEAETTDTLSLGVYGEARGAAQTFRESASSLGLLFVMAIIAIYIILGILYESFVHPLTILSSLPPAILGGLLTLYLFGFSLNLYGYLGLILLIGIVKKNGILVVDFALENKRSKQEEPESAIIDACVVRFRPIMMTTFAAIMGAVPICLASGPGAVGRRSLGYVIIGGLLLSQLITLYLTPVIYLYLDKWNDKLTPKREQDA